MKSTAGGGRGGVVIGKLLFWLFLNHSFPLPFKNKTNEKYPSVIPSLEVAQLENAQNARWPAVPEWMERILL